MFQALLAQGNNLKFANMKSTSLEKNLTNFLLIRKQNKLIRYRRNSNTKLLWWTAT